MTRVETTLDELSRAQRIAMVVGIVGLVATLAGLHDPTQLFRSYLFAYIFWIGLPVGCTGLLMVHHLTGGKWGIPVRRLAEAGAGTFPLMAVLFIPVLIGLKNLYPWANPQIVASDPIIQYKQHYLNPTFFIVRAVIYFAILIYLGARLSAGAGRYDETRDSQILSRLGRLSAPGLILWGLVVTYGSIDWVMSLEPHWFSTIYGFVFIVIAALTAMAFMIFVGSLLANREPLASVVTPLQWNDVGNLLLAFVMLFAYLSFDQFLIIWAGNLKDEIPWYVTRASGGWKDLALFLIIFHFAIPFYLLLMRGVKRRMNVLAKVAFALFFISMSDVYWQLVPAFEPKGPQFHLTDFTAAAGLGGVWIAAFLWRLKGRPLTPIHGGSYAEVAAHGD